MQDPTTYQQALRSNDWTLYFDRQLPDEYFDVVYGTANLEFAVWTNNRNDGKTIVWIQSGTERNKEAIEAYFPDAGWVGSTTATEDFEKSGSRTSVPFS